MRSSKNFVGLVGKCRGPQLPENNFTEKPLVKGRLEPINPAKIKNKGMATSPPRESTDRMALGGTMPADNPLNKIIP